MPTVDLEQSLRAEIDGYVERRLGAAREEIERLRGQLDAALSRLTGDEPTAGGESALTVALADHLRNARNQGIEEAAAGSQRARASSDVALIKAAIDDLEERRTQSDVLNALVNRAASFAPRVAFFVVKNERVTGWRARGLEGTVGDDSVREISLPVSSETLLGEVARTRRTWSGAPGSHAEDKTVYGHFGEELPQRIVAIPLVAREKAVAVLYADSAGLDADAINLEALETLVRVTGMAVELLALKRTPAGASDTSAATAAAPQPAEVEEDAERDEQPAHEGQAVAEQPAREEEAPAAHEEESEAAPSYAAAPSFEAGEPAAAVEPHFGMSPDEASPSSFESASPSSFEETPAPSPFADATPEPSVIAPPPPSEPAGTDAYAWTNRADTAGEPAFSSSAPTPAPAPQRRRDSALPIEVSEQERPLHDKAWRFARLLVSEIKLYNEAQVQEGRAAGDLYGRLREHIDRSRAMYDERYAHQVGARYDYFHHALVSTLAEGDASKLGEGYPGASASA
ncbi:MAG TPA: GAF domain-containing protein [Pyrinomonadaceae bacterium]|nr:GAF domain-containing protein [Pyrinomonadaceae bacterium]